MRPPYRDPGGDYRVQRSNPVAAARRYRDGARLCRLPEREHLGLARTGAKDPDPGRGGGTRRGASGGRRDSGIRAGLGGRRVPGLGSPARRQHDLPRPLARHPRRRGSGSPRRDRSRSRARTALRGTFAHAQVGKRPAKHRRWPGSGSRPSVAGPFLVARGLGGTRFRPGARRCRGSFDEPRAEPAFSAPLPGSPGPDPRAAMLSRPVPGAGPRRFALWPGCRRLAVGRCRRRAPARRPVAHHPQPQSGPAAGPGDRWPGRGICASVLRPVWGEDGPFLIVDDGDDLPFPQEQRDDRAGALRPLGSPRAVR